MPMVIDILNIQTNSRKYKMPKCSQRAASLLKNRKIDILTIRSSNISKTNFFKNSVRPFLFRFLIQSHLQHSLHHQFLMTLFQHHCPNPRSFRLFVCRPVGWSVGRSVDLSVIVYLKGREITYTSNAAIRALVQTFCTVDCFSQSLLNNLYQNRSKNFTHNFNSLKRCKSNNGRSWNGIEQQVRCSVECRGVVFVVALLLLQLAPQVLHLVLAPHLHSFEVGR